LDFEGLLESTKPRKELAHKPIQYWLNRLNMNPFYTHREQYRGADKSIARPGRKQATATADFDFHMSYL
jgi:hypothetical protein